MFLRVFNNNSGVAIEFASQSGNMNVPVTTIAAGGSARVPAWSISTSEFLQIAQGYVTTLADGSIHRGLPTPDGSITYEIETE
jgi:hypothetical protein